MTSQLKFVSFSDLPISLPCLFRIAGGGKRSWSACTTLHKWFSAYCHPFSISCPWSHHYNHAGAFLAKFWIYFTCSRFKNQCAIVDMFLYPGGGCAITIRSIVPYLRKPTHPSFRIAQPHFQRLLFFPLAIRKKCLLISLFFFLKWIPIIPELPEWSYPTVFGQILIQFSAFPHFRSSWGLVGEFPIPSHKSERSATRQKRGTLWDRELARSFFTPVLAYISWFAPNPLLAMSCGRCIRLKSITLQSALPGGTVHFIPHVLSLDRSVTVNILNSVMCGRGLRTNRCVCTDQIRNVIDNLWRVWVRDQWRYTSEGAISDFDYERRTKNHEATRSNR